MLEILKLMTPHQLCQLLYCLTIELFDEGNLSPLFKGKEDWIVQLIKDEMYEVINMKTGLRVRVIESDTNFKHMYVLKKFIPVLIDEVNENVLYELVFGIVRRTSYVYAPRVNTPLSFVCGGPEMELTTNRKDMVEWFRLHHKFRNNGVRFPSKFARDRWIKDNGFSVKHIEDKTLWLSNPWNADIHFFIEEDKLDNGEEVYVGVIICNDTWYYSDAEFANLFMKWVTLELRTQGPHFNY